MKTLLLASLLASAALAEPAIPQTGSAALWGPGARLEAQREAMKGLAFLDGMWRGPAKAADGKQALTQTERVGSLLDGTVKLVEGRGYDGQGRAVFNALGIISYDPVRRTYSMHSYAMGYAGDFPLIVRPDGFSWTQPAGPGSSIRYTATIKDNEWHEVGERIAGGGPPVKTFEMRLRRLGPARWPQADAVPPR